MVDAPDIDHTVGGVQETDVGWMVPYEGEEEIHKEEPNRAIREYHLASTPNPNPNGNHEYHLASTAQTIGNRGPDEDQRARAHLRTLALGAEPRAEGVATTHSNVARLIDLDSLIALEADNEHWQSFASVCAGYTTWD